MAPLGRPRFFGCAATAGSAADRESDELLLLLLLLLNFHDIAASPAMNYQEANTAVATSLIGEWLDIRAVFAERANKSIRWSLLCAKFPDMGKFVEPLFGGHGLGLRRAGRCMEQRCSTMSCRQQTSMPDFLSLPDTFFSSGLTGWPLQMPDLSCMTPKQDLSLGSDNWATGVQKPQGKRAPNPPVVCPNDTCNRGRSTALEEDRKWVSITSLFEGFSFGGGGLAWVGTTLSQNRYRLQTAPERHHQAPFQETNTPITQSCTMSLWLGPQLTFPKEAKKMGLRNSPKEVDLQATNHHGPRSASRHWLCTPARFATRRKSQT